MFNVDDYAKVNELVFDTANVGICVTNKERKFVRVNKAYCELYGFTEAELIGEEFTLVLPADQKSHASKLHDAYIKNENNESAGEWAVRHKKGHLIDVWVTTGRLVDDDGRHFKVTTVTDITLQKQYVARLEKAIEEKDILLKEVHHRVKNNLNMINGLIYLEDDGGSQIVKTKFRNMRNRITSLATVHEKLYFSGDLASIQSDDFLPTLIGDVTSSFTEMDSVEISHQITHFTISENLAINIGLIVNELITNSFKHAFGEVNSDCKVHVDVSKEGSKIIVTVSDNGKGMPINNQDFSSVGFALITNLVGSENLFFANKNGLAVTVHIES